MPVFSVFAVIPAFTVMPVLQWYPAVFIVCMPLLAVFLVFAVTHCVFEVIPVVLVFTVMPVLVVISVFCSDTRLTNVGSDSGVCSDSSVLVQDSDARFFNVHDIIYYNNIIIVIIHCVDLQCMVSIVTVIQDAGFHSDTSVCNDASVCSDTVLVCIDTVIPWSVCIKFAL